MPLLTTVHPLYFTTSSLSPFRIQHSIGASQDTTLQHLEIQLKFSPFQIHESPSTAQCLNTSAFDHQSGDTTYSTDQTQPNRKQTPIKPWGSLSLYTHGLLRVCYGGPRADPKQTPGWPRANPEWTESRPRFQKQSLKSLLKNDQMSLHVYIWNLQGVGLQVVRKKEGTASHFSA